LLNSSLENFVGGEGNGGGVGEGNRDGNGDGDGDGKGKSDGNVEGNRQGKGKATLLIKCICVLTFDSNWNIRFDNTLNF
jgi:hypothetical protein